MTMKTTFEPDFYFQRSIIGLFILSLLFQKYSAMRPPKVAVPSTYEGEELQEQTYTTV